MGFVPTVESKELLEDDPRVTAGKGFCHEKSGTAKSGGEVVSGNEVALSFDRKSESDALKWPLESDVIDCGVKVVDCGVGRLTGLEVIHH
jgi:hypothetical protein